MTKKPTLPDLHSLRALAEAAESNDQHIYTHPRDSNKWLENKAWHEAASPAAVLALLDCIYDLTRANYGLSQVNREMRLLLEYDIPGRQRPATAQAKPSTRQIEAASTPVPPT